ncbi:hypothetical protein [Arthrobacter sulfonylureivorans]|uniref:Zinc ribbon domain-containing protein n=1 Tax=Arthrobacter sulfonylureivorans TaxID=2486855 RepID=A0ABY3W4R7_9MICC|nr:hypothetical protein [Arthrobacter sulfonylureivorans]UNK45219.1 hypothetical protein MNQ99_14935 [Arthrobacter sulfonylureivorans]
MMSNHDSEADPLDETKDEHALLPESTPYTSGTPDSVAETPVKVCRKCSVQSQTNGNFCPQCGATYTARRTGVKVTKKLALITAAVIVLGGTGTGIAFGVQHSNQVKEEQAAAAAQAAEEAAAAEATKRAEEEAAEALAEQEAEDAAARLIRETIVTALEKSVQKDAKGRAKDGSLTGPIKRTECTPLGGGSVDDLTAITGTFECIAVNEVRDDGSESGYVFSATVNWDEASYSWHLGR